MDFLKKHWLELLINILGILIFAFYILYEIFHNGITVTAMIDDIIIFICLIAVTTLSLIFNKKWLNLFTTWFSSIYLGLSIFANIFLSGWSFFKHLNFLPWIVCYVYLTLLAIFYTVWVIVEKIQKKKIVDNTISEDNTNAN